ncbi:uncharacterized protein LOC112527584 [Cynara cardunculus var. scolymus]|uniref:Uncharacterized protein n=1 Tax=Cynara cardunculus var. scolymus TaxID=59895 RepID=A0A118JW84_CYNCS|nr:uncharacterized protein LOC112527584 [Cynara cardunculus var. scolymus]KVH95287.1 hypothetical protein Ccrd_002647 [Cynara cardunculus var. scolymus]
MCRGFQQTERDRLLKIKAFYLSLSFSNTPKHLPDSLTLHYLPRINGSPLEINDSVFRPDSPAFLTLYRVVSDDDIRLGKRSVMYGSRERVRVSEGVRFEVYLREEKVVKGGFRKDEEGEWKMECRCGLEGEMVVEVKKVEVCVAVEGEVEVMRETVEMVVRRKRGRCFERLEEIPEQQSEGEDVEMEEGVCCCCCDCGGGEAENGGEVEVEVEVEGVRWAVDVGIWVMCLGVGYLVSKASSKSLRRRRLL